jgi:hypothetical protein
MEQKEQEWTAWWASRPRARDDGSQSVWVKEQAVLREKKNWWLHTFGEHYWTREDKELQWRNYWESTHGENSEPLDGMEKKQWWRQTFREECPPSEMEVWLAETQTSKRDTLTGFQGPAAALAAALEKQKAMAKPESNPQQSDPMRSETEE